MLSRILRSPWQTPCTMLAHPQPNALISLTTDASDVAIGAVLQQRINDMWVPLVFISKKLRSPETKYSAFDRELLALYLATRHFRYFLEGRSFVAFTDHKPLTFAIGKSQEPWTTEFTTDVRHVSGKENVVADTLSRASIFDVHLGLDYVAMAAAQKLDPEVQSYRTASTNFKLQEIPVVL